MTLRITVEDVEEGTREERLLPEGDYFILTHAPCYVDGIQTYANGTHVLTVKGRRAATKSQSA